MIKSTSTSVPNTIAVNVVSFGNDPVPVALPQGATVAQALAAANVSQGAAELFVSGVEASPEDILENGDTLSVVTAKQAG